MKPRYMIRYRYNTTSIRENFKIQDTLRLRYFNKKKLNLNYILKLKKNTKYGLKLKSKKLALNIDQTDIEKR